jgi:hypothetical protein
MKRLHKGQNNFVQLTVKDNLLRKYTLSLELNSVDFKEASVTVKKQEEQETGHTTYCE